MCCALEEVVERHGGNIVNDDALTNLEIKNLLPNDNINFVDKHKLIMFKPLSRNKILAIVFVEISDRV